MQTRTGFNGGEQSLELAARVDVDAYMRGCRVLENWELSPMGGVKRRKGMRHFAALGDRETNARLFPYIYTYSGNSGRYLVVISRESVRVLDMEGNEVAAFSSSSGNFIIDIDSVRVRQINSILMIVSSENAPLQLAYSDEKGWTLKRYEFKIPPWRYENELRDEPIVVTQTKTSSGAIAYNFDFSEVSDLAESSVAGNDTLRLSYYTPQREAFRLQSALTSGVVVRTSAALAATSKGTLFAVPDEMTIKYFVCTQEFLSTVYCTGLDLPSNYPDNFEEAADVSAYTDVPIIWSIREAFQTGATAIQQGTKFGIRMGYWRYFTCIKDFTESDIVDGVTGYSAYPEYFREGIAIGNALPCKGKWKFWCSGTWYGSYKVIRNYEQTSFSAGTWEDVGVSFSRNADAENNTLSGDESDEECYLRLVLTRSRRISTDTLSSGFPGDGCGNRLIVESYRHDTMLRLTETEDASTGAVTHTWTCLDKIKDTWYGKKRVYNWSWHAFSQRYGFPRLCEVFSQRLVFGATAAQPQTIWLSRTDDIDNFDVVDSDTSAICLTMQTTSQNPICWILSQNYRLLLGTAEGEYILSSGSMGAALTPDNATLQDHGHVGSEPSLALGAVDRILYIERGAGRCYEFGYSYETDSYRSSDLTVLAPHVLRDHGGAVDCTLLRKPDTVAVFALADGQLALCAYVPMQNVKAWHRWATDGKVLGVCAMPNGTAGDRLFMKVERNGVRAIEVVDEESGYEDAGGSDYASTLVTNALGNTMEVPVTTTPSRPVLYHFGGEVQVAAIEVCSDGENWSAWAKNDTSLPRGWHKTPTVNKWKFEQFVGLRVTGATPCHLLAIQA